MFIECSFPDELADLAAKQLADALVKEPLKAKTGETVRIFFGVGGILVGVLNLLPEIIAKLRALSPSWQERAHVTANPSRSTELTQ